MTGNASQACGPARGQSRADEVSMVYPVFAAFARDLAGATPYKIGVTLGIYGLSQGAFAGWVGVSGIFWLMAGLALAGLVMFFAGFNIMEASLPSLVTKTAPTGATGHDKGRPPLMARRGADR
jgi:hypothetical protein